MVAHRRRACRRDQRHTGVLVAYVTKRHIHVAAGAHGIDADGTNTYGIAERGMMSVIRAMGTETEYAVMRSRTQAGDPMALSFALVEAAAHGRPWRIPWDYRQEDPLCDARGMRLAREYAPNDMLTDAPQHRIVNVVGANGSRVYVDHAHPEYAACETGNPYDALAYAKAGDALMAQAARRVRERGEGMIVYRNNTDGKGASWGTHDNYAVERAVPFDLLVWLMSAHWVTRVQYCGSGRVGLGEHGEQAGFQLSQRADFFHMRVGLHTTFDRPIINTRDEPHVEGAYRRLHGITMDANCLDVPRVLACGTTSMLLWWAEQAVREDDADEIARLRAAVELADSVAAMHEVSHDCTLSVPLELAGGEQATAWQIQVTLYTAVCAMGARCYGTDSRGEPLWPDGPTVRTMAQWRQALQDVATIRHGDDEERLSMTAQAGRIEWLLKWQLLERARRRYDTDWADVRLKALDMEWGRLDEQGLAGKMSGRVSVVADDTQVAEAMAHAPSDTRAWLRAALLNRFPDQVVTVSWSRVVVRGRDGALHDVLMDRALGFGREECERLCEEASCAADIARGLAG